MREKRIEFKQRNGHIEKVYDRKISNDSYGIENMDAKYLAEDLIENEPEFFE